MSNIGTGKGGKTLNDRELAAKVRTLTLKECEKALNKKKGKLYEAVLLKLAGSVLPRLNEVMGEGGGPLQVIVPKEVAGTFGIDESNGKTENSDSEQSEV